MERNRTWKRIEPQLYRLKDQTPTGECTTRYCVPFKDWKRVNRRIPAAQLEDLTTALGRREADL